MTRGNLSFVVLLVAMIVAGCSSHQAVVKVTPDPASAPLRGEPAWVHLDRGPCPAPYPGGYCAVGRASGAYASSLGIRAASTEARAKLAEWMRERLSVRFEGDQGSSVAGPGLRPRSLDTARLHIEAVTSAVVGGIAVPEWTFSRPARPGDPSTADFVALARVTEDQLRDARGILDQLQLEPDERKEAIQAYELFIEDLRERERAQPRTRR